MSLAALGAVRRKAELLRGMAVQQDITRWTTHKRGYDGELIDPETAAEHLLAVAEENDFTLFEYFLTDRAGHSGDPELIDRCLETLESFLSGVTAFTDKPGHQFLLSSDHGNIEDLSTLRHTRNPVPLVALGDASERLRKATSLTDVTPAIVECME